MAWTHFPLNPDSQDLVSREPILELAAAATERGMSLYSTPAALAGAQSAWGLRNIIEYNISAYSYWYSGTDLDNIKKYTTGSTTSTHKNIFEDVFGAGVTDWPYEAYAGDGIRARDLNQIYQVLDALRYVAVTVVPIQPEWQWMWAAKREQVQEWWPNDEWLVGPHITAGEQAIQTAACDAKYRTLYGDNAFLHTVQQLGSCIYDYTSGQWYAKWTTAWHQSIRRFYKLQLPSGYAVSDHNWKGVKGRFNKEAEVYSYLHGDPETHLWPLARTLTGQIRMGVTTAATIPKIYTTTAEWGDKVGTFTFPAGFGPGTEPEDQEFDWGTGVTGSDDLHLIILMDDPLGNNVAGANLPWHPDWYYDPPEYPEPPWLGGGSAYEEVSYSFREYMLAIAKFEHQT